MYQLINPGLPVPSKETISRSTDCTKCIVCQTVTDERLQCPADIKRSDIDSGLRYSTFAHNLACFHELGSVPMSLDIQRLDEGNGVASTLGEHSAKWHKSCHVQFNTTLLKRDDKRQSLDSDLPTPSKQCTILRRVRVACRGFKGVGHADYSHQCGL